MNPSLINAKNCSICNDKRSLISPPLLILNNQQLTLYTTIEEYISTQFPVAISNDRKQSFLHDTYISGTITYSDFPPINNPLEWKNFIRNNFKTMEPLPTTLLLYVLEQTPTNFTHLHYVYMTTSRSDNAVRKLQSLHMKQQHSIIKITGQKVKSIEALLIYLWKNPLLIITNNEDFLQFFRNYQHSPLTDTTTMIKTAFKVKDLTHALIHLIPQEKITSYSDCLHKLPTLMTKFIHLPNIHKLFDNALEFVNSTQQKFDLILYLKTTKTCTNANSDHITNILNKQNINPYQFANDILLISTKKMNKINTLILQGVPNSAKSTLIRSFLLLFPTYGEILNTSNFMFQDLLNKPIALWEEPLIDANIAEKLKLIMEGQTTQIDVKFKQPQTLHKTPLLITTNADLWTWASNAEDAFIKRGIYYYFPNSLTFENRNSCTRTTNPQNILSDSDTDTTSLDQFTTSPNHNSRKRSYTFDNSNGSNDNNRTTNNNTAEPQCSTSQEEPTDPKRQRQSPKKKEVQNSTEHNLVRRKLYTPDVELLLPHTCDWVKFLKEYTTILED
uniref:NS1 protein n=1 Tax=Mops bat parvovirus TaxID=3141925 RepID=A0AAU7E1H2_9VIRU